MGTVLNIDTLAPDRETVNIKSKEHPEGKLYELAHAEDLGLSDQQFLYSRGLRLDALVKRRTELGDEEKAELDMILEGMVGLVLPDLPPEIRERIGAMPKVQIVEVFIAASPGLEKKVAEAEKAMTKATPEN